MAISDDTINTCFMADERFFFFFFLENRNWLHDFINYVRDDTDRMASTFGQFLNDDILI